MPLDLVEHCDLGLSAREELLYDMTAEEAAAAYDEVRLWMG